MADNTFEILIKYGLDASKAREAATELQKVKMAAEDTGKASEIASQKGAAGALKHTQHIEGLHKATSLLYRQFGELGHLWRGFVSLPALGITALAIGINKGIELAEEFRAKIIEARKEIDDLNNAKLAGVNSEFASALGELNRLRLALAHGSDQNDPIGQAWKERRTRMEAEAKARGTTLTAEQDQALISGELKQRLGAQPALAAAAMSATAKATAPNEELIAVTAELAAATAKRPELQKALREASVATLQEQSAAGLQGVKGQEWLANLIAERAGKAQAALNSNLGDITRAQARVNELTWNRGELQDAASRAQAAAKGNAGAIGGLYNQLGLADQSQMGSLMGGLPTAAGSGISQKIIAVLHANKATNDEIAAVMSVLLDQQKSMKEKMDAYKKALDALKARP